ncbi:MAG: cell division protein FtsA [Patescibacteria group bacterium]
MSSNYITGLDVGTSSVKVVVAENRNGRPALRAVFKEPSSGVKKGAVIDLAEASQAIGRALGGVKGIAKAAVKNIYLSIGTHQVKAQSSRGIVAVSRADTEIYQDDIDKVIKASQAVNLAPNRTIIHNITREFVVDGVGDIFDPLGLSGSRLEVNSLVVDAFSPHIKSLVRAVELGGGSVSGLIFGPIVSSRSSLSKNQKELGAVLIDIGFGTTGVGVYEEGKLINAVKFPVGAGNISNDLAVGLKIPVDAAEDLKLSYGYALSKEVGQKESVDLKKFYPQAKGGVSRRFVAEIIESRLSEILELVNGELKTLGKGGQLPGGAILVGGGAKMPGLTELVKRELKLASQIGLTLNGEWESQGSDFSEFLEDPEYAVAFGLVLHGTDEEEWQKRGSFSGFSIRKAVKYFLP